MAEINNCRAVVSALAFAVLVGLVVVDGLPVHVMDAGDPLVAELGTEFLGVESGKGVQGLVEAAERASEEARRAVLGTSEGDVGDTPATPAAKPTAKPAASAAKPAATAAKPAAAKTTAASKPAYASTAAAAPKTTPKPKPLTLREAKIRAYIAKIKKVEKQKKQDWGAEEENHLANQLLTLDELSKTTKDEHHIEHSVRKPLKINGKVKKGFEIELSLKKRKEQRVQHKKEAAALRAKERQEAEEKRQHDIDIALEKKRTNEVINRFRKIAVPKVLNKQIKKAAAAVKDATVKSEARRKNPAVKELTKEYRLDQPVEKDAGYPKSKAGSKSTNKPVAKKTAAAKPTSKTAAPAKKGGE